MSRERSYKSFVCDFETTVFDDQDFTEVWAAACVEIYTEDVFIFHSIGEFFKHIFSIPGNKHLYFHNLKFDGFFILSYLMDVLKWDQAAKIDPETGEPHFIERWQMKNRTFQYLISEMGQFYSITMKFNGQFVEIRDSLKLLPFSVKEIGRSFHTKHQKLEMEYTGFRYAGCEITPEEMHYIKNDVLVVKEALEFLFSEGHKQDQVCHHGSQIDHHRLFALKFAGKHHIEEGKGHKQGTHHNAHTDGNASVGGGCGQRIQQGLNEYVKAQNQRESGLEKTSCFMQ